jgi:TonB family protein
MSNMKACFPFATMIMIFVCGFVAGYPQETGSQAEDDRIYQLKEVDKKPEILRKPARVRTDDSCREFSSGTAVFEVVLHRTGKVMKIKRLRSSFCQIFDRNAHDALMKVEFNPAVKGGEKVSVMQKFSFQFSYY